MPLDSINCGSPVVTNQGSNIDWLFDSICEKGCLPTPTELAKKIDRLLNDQELYIETRKRGLNGLSNQQSWEAAYEAAIVELLNWIQSEQSPITFPEMNSKRNQARGAIVIGNGLIGREFDKQAAIFSPNVLILAAGVSDSRSQNKSEFQREMNLVRHYSAESKRNGYRVVYISTYSVNENPENPSMYVQNKMACEKVILDSSDDNVIVRLTNVIGIGGNDNNILNFLIRTVKNNQHFTVWEKAQRNFVAAELTPRFVKFILKKNGPKRTFELVSPVSYYIEEIVKILEDHLNIKANYKLSAGMENSFESNHESQQFFDELNEPLDLKYLIKKIDPTSY